jgi:hypothetical protein
VRAPGATSRQDIGRKNAFLSRIVPPCVKRRGEARYRSIAAAVVLLFGFPHPPILDASGILHD